MRVLIYLHTGVHVCGRDNPSMYPLKYHVNMWLHGKSCRVSCHVAACLTSTLNMVEHVHMLDHVNILIATCMSTCSN